MDISFHPPPNRDDRRSLRAMVPWWRRGWAWISDAHRFVVTVIAVCGTTIVIHVWLKGLITRAELDVAVAASVTTATDKVLLEIRGDLAIIKMNTAGLPDWRGSTTAKVIALEQQVAGAQKLAEKNENRIDTYLTSRMRR
jgi:hypothetical protein